jgi:hypothetical protein
MCRQCGEEWNYPPEPEDEDETEDDELSSSVNEG